MTKITSLKARQILDSRGNPTVEAELTLASGASGLGMVPSGASTGTREAIELRDGDKHLYGGKGVQKVVNSINNDITKVLVGMDINSQTELDKLLCELDGTPNKSRLGANAVLAISLAAAHALAGDRKQELFNFLHTEFVIAKNLNLPMPLMNILNGGAHANNNIDIQEFMIVPVGAADLATALRYGVEVFHALRKQLQQDGHVTAVGDEGGFAPNLDSNIAALDYIMQAITATGLQPGKDIALALDVASSEFYSADKYHLSSEDKQLSSFDFISYLEKLSAQYPIISIEDGLAEQDWAGWQELTKRMGDKVQLVGDDLFVTNTEILQKGIAEDIANAILIKPNQIGTLSETVAAIKMAQKSNYGVIISHRSGETEDTTIADLAVATAAGQIKTGSLCRSDRIAKYNRLLRIAEACGGTATFATR